MFGVTRYCVQPYVKRAGGLAPGEVLALRELGPAMRAAKVMLRRHAGVGVYRLDGWPIQDLWREPVLIASFGAVPERAHRDQPELLRERRLA